MSRAPNRPASPELLARAEKKRVAIFEGVAAIADVEKQAIAVRANMKRLRALRLAKEAEDAANQPPPTPKVKKAAKAKSASRPRKVSLDEGTAE